MYFLYPVFANKKFPDIFFKQDRFLSLRQLVRNQLACNPGSELRS